MRESFLWASGRPTSLRYYRLLLWVGLLVLALTLLHLFPSSTLSSAASARVSALTDSWTSTPSSRCRRNPFSSPGYLTSSNYTLTENRWHPYAEGCSTPSLVAPVLARDPFPWLHNRTVVIFGSSVDRNHVNFFCKFARGRLVTVMPESPLSPRPLEAGWLPEGASVGPASQPRYCRIEEYSFTIVFVFHYGILQDWSDYNLASPVRHFTPPSLAEDRLSSLLLPFLDHLQSANFAGPIDLLEASSIEWDLEAWQFSSAQRKSGSELHLQDAWDTYLPLFALRLPQLAEALIQAFPRHSKTTLGRFGPILWRLPHLSLRKAPAPIVNEAMAAATRQVFADNPVLRKEFEMDETGTMLEGGLREWMSDATHPAPLPNGYVWCDYILWQLRKAVTGEV